MIITCLKHKNTKTQNTQKHKTHKMNQQIRLKCFKIGSRLRVRIVSPGYNNDANCQFPRAIREEGREYIVPSSAISFSEGSNRKFFYRVKKNEIQVLGVDDTSNIEIDRVYGDEDIDTECNICMSNEKDVVFAPCGHYCCCNGR